MTATPTTSSKTTKSAAAKMAGDGVGLAEPQETEAEEQSLRQRLRLLYHGHSSAAHRFRYSLLAFDLITLERIIIDLAKKELRAIELLGGLLGFLIGIVQYLILIQL